MKQPLHTTPNLKSIQGLQTPRGEKDSSHNESGSKRSTLANPAKEEDKKDGEVHNISKGSNRSKQSKQNKAFKIDPALDPEQEEESFGIQSSSIFENEDDDYLGPPGTNPIQGGGSDGTQNRKSTLSNISGENQVADEKGQDISQYLTYTNKIGFSRQMSQINKMKAQGSHQELVRLKALGHSSTFTGITQRTSLTKVKQYQQFKDTGFMLPQEQDEESIMRHSILLFEAYQAQQQKDLDLNCSIEAQQPQQRGTQSNVNEFPRFTVFSDLEMKQKLSSSVVENEQAQNRQSTVSKASFQSGDIHNFEDQLENDQQNLEFMQQQNSQLQTRFLMNIHASIQQNPQWHHMSEQEQKAVFHQVYLRSLQEMQQQANSIPNQAIPPVLGNQDAQDEQNQSIFQRAPSYENTYADCQGSSLFQQDYQQEMPNFQQRIPQSNSLQQHMQMNKQVEQMPFNQYNQGQQFQNSKQPTQFPGQGVMNLQMGPQHPQMVSNAQHMQQVPNLNAQQPNQGHYLGALHHQNLNQQFGTQLPMQMPQNQYNNLQLNIITHNINYNQQVPSPSHQMQYMSNTSQNQQMQQMQQQQQMPSPGRQQYSGNQMQYMQPAQQYGQVGQMSHMQHNVQMIPQMSPRGQPQFGDNMMQLNIPNNQQQMARSGPGAFTRLQGQDGQSPAHNMVQTYSVQNVGGAKKSPKNKNGGQSQTAQQLKKIHQLLQLQKQCDSPQKQLLNEEQMNSLGQLTLDITQGHEMPCCKDQKSSRFIQDRLTNEAVDINEKRRFLDRILKEGGKSQHLFRSLITDPFGNYVLQKVLIVGKEIDEEYLDLLFQNIIGNVYKYSKDKHGCRVMQIAFDSFNIEYQNLMVSEIINQGLVKECSFNFHGNHVVQRIVVNMGRLVDSAIFKEVIKEIEDHIIEYCQHEYCCRIVQRMFEQCHPSLVEASGQQIIHNYDNLCKNEFGIFVLSSVLEHGSEQFQQQILLKVQGKAAKMALEKDGSKLIENCIKMIQQAKNKNLNYCVNIYQILDEIINLPASGIIFQPQLAGKQEITFSDLLTNQYSNYVIQKSFDMSDTSRKQLILGKIELLFNENAEAGDTPLKHILQHLQFKGYQLLLQPDNKTHSFQQLASPYIPRLDYPKSGQPDVAMGNLSASLQQMQLGGSNQYALQRRGDDVLKNQINTKNQ